MKYVVQNDSGTYLAVVSDADDGCIAQYFRAGAGTQFLFVRERFIPAPMHVALDTVHRIVHFGGGNNGL